MNESKNYIRNIINDALFKGEIKDVDEITNIIFNRYLDEEVLSDEESNNMIQRLQLHQKNVFERRKKLGNINLIKTIGEYLQFWQEEEELNDEEIAKEININKKELSMIRKDSISPINIDVRKMTRLLNFLKLKLEEARILIEKTYLLANIELKGIAALSRNDAKKTATPSRSMKNAYEELLIKANKRKPLIKKEKDDLREYLRELEENWEN